MTERRDEVLEIAQQMFFSWLVELANMRGIKDVKELESRMSSHLPKLMDELAGNYELYFLSADLHPQGCDIELKAYTKQHFDLLESLSRWCSSQVTGFSVNFHVYEWVYETNPQ